MKLTSSPLMGDDSKPDKTSVLIKFRCGKSEDLPLLFSPASPQRKKLHLVFRCLNFEMIHRISKVNGPLFAACCSIAFLFDAGTCCFNVYRIPFSVPLRFHIMSRSYPIVNPVAYIPTTCYSSLAKKIRASLFSFCSPSLDTLCLVSVENPYPHVN